MKGLTEYILGVCDLCEAEGRLLRYSVLKFLRVVILQIVGAVFGVAAFIFWLIALYHVLKEFIGEVWTLSILGLVCAALAGGLLWIALKKKPPSQ